MKPNSRRLLRVAVIMAAAAIIGLALAGCAEPDYTGTGNGFVVDATVQHGGKQSVTVIIDRVDEAHGEAAGWFGVETSHQIHNNYSTTSKTHHVGVLTDGTGQVIAPKSLHAGQHLHIVGEIRDSDIGRTWETRPVYDTAVVTN